MTTPRQQHQSRQDWQVDRQQQHTWPDRPYAEHQQQQQQHPGLDDWLLSRQRAFRDFERSFQPHQQHPPPFPLLPAVVPPRLPPHLPLSLERPHTLYHGPYLTHPLHQQQQEEHNSSSIDPNSRPSSSQFTFNTMLSNRSNSNNDLSPKARVTYDDAKFQVEFDVKDYRPEELSIKTEGDVLIVLAKHETKTEDGGSFVSKQFEQRFTLPSGVDPEAITSSLARDGTLTVSAPRHMPVKHEAFKRPLTQSNSNSNATTSYTNSPVYNHSSSTNDAEGLPHPKVKYDDDKFQINLDCHNYRPEELDVKVEGNSIIIQAKQEMKETGGTRTRVFEQKFTLPSGVVAEKVSSSYGKDGTLTITAPRATNSISYQRNRSPPSSIEQRMDRVLSPSNWDDNFRTSRSGITSNSDYGSGIREKSLFDRDPAFFSGSNSANFGGENGISKVQYDEENYKILVNVKDFKPEELIIKTVGNTVHFEAKHEEKTSDGHSYTSRNISQSFTLPRGVDPDTVSSSLSRDGVLTISAPLPQALKLQNQERLVPIKHR